MLLHAAALKRAAAFHFLSFFSSFPYIGAMAKRKNTPQPQPPTNPKTPRSPMRSLFSNFFTIILILLFLAFGIPSLFNSSNDAAKISISELAADVNAGKVTMISVEGDELQVEYKAGDKKESKKESDSALTETLARYGTNPEKLAAVKIEVKNPSGLGYWFVQIVPFLLPLIGILFILWFFTRGARGAGMQAFSFGQSKARMISPHDKKQKVTFKDVAGVKEAKEELSEIVGGAAA